MFIKILLTLHCVRVNLSTNLKGIDILEVLKKLLAITFSNISLVKFSVFWKKNSIFLPLDMIPPIARVFFAFFLHIFICLFISLQIIFIDLSSSSLKRYSTFSVVYSVDHDITLKWIIFRLHMVFENTFFVTSVIFHQCVHSF